MTDLDNSIDPEAVRRGLSTRFPRMEHSDMDNSDFYFSMDYRPETDELIEFGGRMWKVLYSWLWYSIAGVKVYAAEVVVAYD